MSTLYGREGGGGGGSLQRRPLRVHPLGQLRDLRGEGRGVSD